MAEAQQKAYQNPLPLSKRNWTDAGRQPHLDAPSIASGKLLQLGIEFRIQPVCAQHAGFQSINDHGDCNPTLVAEGVFQTRDEALGPLPPDHFAVGRI